MRSIVFFLISMISFSQNIEKDTIKVGVKLDPPFTMKYDNGHYSGLCVDLVKGIDVPYKLVEVTGTYDEIIDRIAKDSVNFDYFFAPTTITKDRLSKVNFSQPFYATSTSIAYTDNAKSNFRVISLLIPIGKLAITVILLGGLFFFIEATKNDAIEKNVKGYMNSLIWVSATMTTVGEGYVVAKTRIGKFMSLTLMWVSMILTGYMILQIDNATEKQPITLGDLNKCKVATISGSHVSKFLESNDIKYISYNDPEEAFIAMNEGDLDAFVYDTPVLQYLIGKDMFSGINLSEDNFESQTFGVIGKGSLRELNIKILDFISNEEWEDVLNKYNLK